MDNTVFAEEGLDQALENVGSPMEQVCRDAIEELVLRGPQSVPGLIGRLTADDVQVRENAAMALQMLGPDSVLATDALIRRLETDESEVVRRAAALALGSIGQPSIKQLTSRLKHNSSQVRSDCMTGLLSMGAMARPALFELTAALKHSDPIVRRGAIRLLGQMGREARTSISELVEILKNSDDSNERWLASASLGRMGPVIIPAMSPLLPGQPSDLRTAVAVALAGTGTEGETLLAKHLTRDDIATLLAAFDHSDIQLSRWGARALEIIGPPAVPALGQLLERDDVNLQFAVMFSLIRLRGDALPTLPGVLARLNDKNPEVRRRAVYTVQRMGRRAKAAVPALIDIIRKNDDFRLQHSTIRVLAVFHEDAAAATPYLLESLKLEHPTVTKMASRTLSRIGPAAHSAIISGLGSEHAEVRRGCAMTLAQMPVEDAMPIVLRVLREGDPRSRAAAADAVRRIGTAARDAEPLLTAMLRDSSTDPRSVAAARLALRRVRGESEQSRREQSAPVIPKVHAESTALPAFPGAEGFGSTTPGGRGGRVLMVTNLNDSGPGSLRYACESKGPRIVVFRVSGVIELEQRLIITEPYLTIAGQTAPGGGICLKNHGLRIIDTHDVVVRHLRMRSGDLTNINQDSLDVFRSKRVVIDHCSISWGTDEVLDTIGDVEVSFGWCMVTEGLPDGWHSKDTHGKGSLLSAESGGITLHHSIHAHQKRRSPRIGGQREDSPGVVFDCRNNVIYNWGDKAGQSTTSPVWINYVGNYLKPGPSTLDEARPFAFSPGGRLTRLFMSDNYMEGLSLNERDQWQLVDFSEGGSEREVRVNQPFWVPKVTTHSPQSAYEIVLKQAGAVLPDRDADDERIVSEIRSGTGSIIDSQSWVGGWPSYPQKLPPRDSDRDGMPDDWEWRYKLDPRNPADHASDADQDGYTNIEEYLNGTSPVR